MVVFGYVRMWVYICECVSDLGSCVMGVCMWECVWCVDVHGACGVWMCLGGWTCRVCEGVWVCGVCWVCLVVCETLGIVCGVCGMCGVFGVYVVCALVESCVGMVCVEVCGGSICLCGMFKGCLCMDCVRCVGVCWWVCCVYSVIGCERECMWVVRKSV